MKHPNRLGAVAALVLSSAVAAIASPVSYDESVDGDLAWDGDLRVFELGVGVNTFVGTFAGPTADFDSVAFTVPAGLAFAGGRIEITDEPGGNLQMGAWDLVTGSFGGGGEFIQDYVLPSPGAATIAANLVLPGRAYHLSNTAFGGDAGSAGKFTFTMTVVPEPASVALVVAASSIALGRRPRRR
jgi:hypothetical protein